MYYAGSFMQVLSTQHNILVYTVDTGHTYVMTLLKDRIVEKYFKT